MPGFARGGFVAGNPPPIRIERLGQCIKCGLCLYSFDGGEPEHICTADAVRRGDLTALNCDGREADE